MPATLIFVPIKSHDSKLFKIVAQTLSKKIYGGMASIYGVIVKKTNGPLDWSSIHIEGPTLKQQLKDGLKLSTFMTISHGGPDDGPVMAYDPKSLQPWGSNAAKSALSTTGTSFWKFIGGKMQGKGGKIILIGCHMGEANYARNVALTSGIKCYAVDGEIAAANETTVLDHVGAIEQGNVIKPMKKFSP